MAYAINVAMKTFKDDADFAGKIFISINLIIFVLCKKPQ